MTLLDSLRTAQANDRAELNRLTSLPATQFTNDVEARATALSEAIATRQTDIDNAVVLDARAASSDAAHLRAGDVGTTSTVTTRSRDTYASERDKRGERSFFSDLWASEQGDVTARSRIAQFNSEHARSTTTSSFAGLVVPQYITDEAALIARSGRPIASTIRHLAIPDQGMTFTVTKGTTGASAAIQATQNTAVSNTDEVWADVPVNVLTIAGQQDVARQALDRGTPGLDSLIFNDLVGAYFAAQESQIVTGTGTGQKGLQNAGGTQSTAFAAAATAATFQSKVAGAVSAVSSNRFLSPTHIAMHPRRWAWLLAQVDSSNRPLVVPGAYAQNVPAAGSAQEAYGQTSYEYMGLRVVISAAIPTAVGSGPEDVVFVYRAADHILWESSDSYPYSLRFEQTTGGSLTVKLVLYGYTAFTAERYPLATAIVGGNSASGFGLVSPTF